MSTFVHKVKDVFSHNKDHEDHPTSSSDSGTQSTDSNYQNQQYSSNTIDNDNAYSNNTVPAKDSRIATADPTGQGRFSSNADYDSRTATIDSRSGDSVAGGFGTTQYTTPGYGDDISFSNSKNPRDAAHVPPSVLTDHVKSPDVPRGESFTDHGRRHSVNTETEALRKYGSGSA